MTSTIMRKGSCWGDVVISMRMSAWGVNNIKCEPRVGKCEYMLMESLECSNTVSVMEEGHVIQAYERAPLLSAATR